MSDWEKKARPDYMLSAINHFEYPDTNWVKGKGQKRIYSANTKLQKSGVAILISCSEARCPRATW